MKKFWNWKNQTETAERTLFLNGTIAEESWFDDDVTPQLFKDELMSGSGNITVWINSPGGDCVAAAQIYNIIYRMAVPFSCGIRSGFSHIGIVTLCILTHIFKPKTQSVPLFLLLFFQVKAAGIDDAAVPTMLLPAVRFGQQRERVYFRNLTKNADNFGIFGLCTP